MAYSIFEKLLYSKLLYLKINMLDRCLNDHNVKCNWILNSSKGESSKVSDKIVIRNLPESQTDLFLWRFPHGWKRFRHTNVGPRDKVTLKSRGINWSSTGIRSDNYLGDEAAPIKWASCSSRLAKTGSPMLISKVYAGSEFHIEL